MRPPIYALLVVLTILPGYAAASPLPQAADSVSRTEAEIAELQVKVEMIRERDAVIRATYRAFLLWVVGLLALAGLIHWGLARTEARRIRQDLNSHIDDKLTDVQSVLSKNREALDLLGQASEDLETRLSLLEARADFEHHKPMGIVTMTNELRRANREGDEVRIGDVLRTLSQLIAGITRPFEPQDRGLYYALEGVLHELENIEPETCDDLAQNVREQIRELLDE